VYIVEQQKSDVCHQRKTQLVSDPSNI